MKRHAFFGVVLGLAQTGCSQGLEVFDLRAPDRISARGDGAGQVRIEWTPVSGASAYRVYAAPGEVTSDNYDDLGGLYFDEADSPAQVNVTDDLLFSFVVTAFAGERESEDSPRVHAFAQVIELLPAAPDQLISEPSDMTARMGTALAAGDVNCDGRDDLEIGAPEPDNTAGDGEVRLHLGTGVAVSPVPNRLHGDTNGFGKSVALGDVTNDGCAEILAGGPLDSNRRGLGLLYNGGHYDVGNQLWSAQGNQDDARFGETVAMLGDVDGDGLGDFAASELGPGASPAIHVFAGAPFPSTNDLGSIDAGGGNFGLNPVVPVGDIDGDGGVDILVGIPGFDAGAGGAEGGRASIWSWSGSDFTSLWSADGAASSRFGSAAALADLLDDGYPDLVVGAPNGAGSLSLFLRDESGLATTPIDVVLGVSSNDALGYAMAAAGDLDADGSEDLFVSSPFAEVAPGDARGKAWLYLGRRDPTFEETWSATGPATDSAFGVAIAAGDFDGDGVRDLAVGAPGRETTGGGPEAGEVSIYLTRVGLSPLPDAGDPLRGAPNERLAPNGAWFVDRARNRRWRCTWEPGDGSPATILEPCTPETAGDFHHAWPEGRWVLRLKVERLDDGLGLFGESATTVEIEQP